MNVEIRTNDVCVVSYTYCNVFTIGEAIARHISACNKKEIKAKLSEIISIKEVV